tara:strand:+ start:293 stop:565 length:273 start_codon:yes stop_codon:yes gene_type:complete
MPQRRTSIKDLRQSKKRRLKNLGVKNKLKTTIKKFKKSLESTEKQAREESLKEMCKVLDRAASKKIIHKNKAARKKSRLSKLMKKAPAKK